MFSYSVPHNGGEGGYGLVTDRFVLVVSGALAHERVTELWNVLSDESTTVEDALTTVARHGVRNLPDFALVELVDANTGSVTIAVRGSGFVEVGSARPQTYEGAGAVTWVEASAQRIDEMVLGLNPISDGIMRLPFRRGVVRTGQVFWGIASETSTSQADRAEMTLLSRRRSQQRDNEHAIEQHGANDTRGGAMPVDDATILSSRRKQATPVWALAFETGQVIVVDEDIVLGRSPKLRGAPLARLEKILSPTREVSGTHARLSPGADGVTVQDLESTNGTRIVWADGRESELRGGEPITLAPGDRVNFGDGNIGTCVRHTPPSRR